MTSITHFDPNHWHGEWEGLGSGSGVSLIFVTTEDIGYGPGIHRHPYPETFVVLSGRAMFLLSANEFVAVAGDVVVVPAGSAHKFENLGPERLQMTNIHSSPNFITEWLEQ